MIALLLALALAAPPAPLPRVMVRTALGDLVIEVDEARAPATARNFLRYVDAGRYAGGSFHPDGQGFAVLGRVVSGMEVVRRIHASPAQGQSLSPPVKILGAARVAP